MPRKKKPRPIRGPCPICGEAIPSQEGQSGPTRKYCSLKCAHEATKRRSIKWQQKRREPSEA